MTLPRCLSVLRPGSGQRVVELDRALADLVTARLPLDGDDIELIVADARAALESADPESADSATSTEETADRGVEGSARPDTDSDSDRPASADDTGSDDTPSTAGDSGSTDAPAEGFVASLIRDSTITGLPGETGAPPVEPHSPEAQQQGDEPVGAEPQVGDNPHGVD
jgi:hypothetical protein